MSEIPSELKYTQDHFYVRLEGNTATVGLTEYAPHPEDIVFEDLSVGEEVIPGLAFGRIGSDLDTNGLNYISIPVGGTIEARNEQLDDNLELIIEDPYGEGWIVKIRVDDDPSSVEELLSASQYEEFLKESERLLKEAEEFFNG